MRLREAPIGSKWWVSATSFKQDKGLAWHIPFDTLLSDKPGGNAKVEIRVESGWLGRRVVAKRHPDVHKNPQDLRAETLRLADVKWED